jgi:ABC-2 type transport system ATP-binding protein
VSHCYGTRQALNDVTFSIAPSTFAVLLGLNGAGKSTLFSLITRLYAVQHGHIRIFGRGDMPRAKPCAWSVSYFNNGHSTSIFP